MITMELRKYDTLNYDFLPGVITLNQPGFLSNFNGVQRWYPRTAITLTDIFASVGQTSTTDITLELCKNLASVSFILIPTGSNESSIVPISGITITPSNFLTLNIIASGGSDLSVRIRFN